MLAKATLAGVTATLACAYPYAAQRVRTRRVKNHKCRRRESRLTRHPRFENRPAMVRKGPACPSDCRRRASERRRYIKDAPLDCGVPSSISNCLKILALRFILSTGTFSCQPTRQ